jgi:hypothetical protein
VTVLLVLLAGWQQSAPPTPREEFLAHAERVFAGDNPTLGRAPRERLEARLREADLKPVERLELTARLAKERLQAGDVELAIGELEAELSRTPEAPAELLRLARRTLALGWLRLSEDQNCVEAPSAACCLFPLEGPAVHARPEPARAAFALFRQLLEDDPSDLESRWLLNLTAMALDEWPDGVPEAWQLPEAAFESEGPMRTFEDVAHEAGVDGRELAGGIAAEDWDGDDWIDLLVSSSDPRQPLRLHVNRRDGTFADQSAEAGVTDQLGGLNLIAGDYDNDGDRDALVLRGGWQRLDGCVRHSLLANDGHAHFTDVTRAAGIAEPAMPSQAAVWADFDGDGWLDLYVGNESTAELGERGNSFPSQLFHNLGDGRFEDIAPAAGVTNDRFAKAVCVGDPDLDGDLDLYVSNIGENRLYQNQDGRFRDVARPLGVNGPVGRSFACWFFDHDENGWPDLLVWGYSASVADLAAAALGQETRAMMPCLYRNRGGRFRDVAARKGLARVLLPMGANFGDVDNDGWQDIYLGTGWPPLQELMPNVLLHNAGGRRFLDVTRAAGLGHLQKGHGIAFLDFDHDGDQDIFHQLGGFFPVDVFRSALFRNPGPAGQWVTLELVGTKANRDAVGARVTLVLDTPAGPRELHRYPGSVSSFGGSPHRLDVGLGDASAIERIEVVWPGGGEPQVFRAPPMRARLRLTQGREDPERLDLPE